MKSIRRISTIAVVIVLGMVLSGCQIVDDGQLGVSKSFGKINPEALQPGPYVFIPVIREVEVWNTKTQSFTRRFDIPSNEGLIIKVESKVLFKPVDVVNLRKTVGPDYIRVILEPNMQNTFREVIGKQRIEEVITTPEKLTQQAEKILRKILKGKIEVQSLLVTGLILPDTFKAAIERKLASKEKARQKEFELKQAKKDAEIEVARAEGAAKAQEIVRRTLSPEYLQYLWISTLNQNPNVIYVATEANMPVFRAMQSPRKKKIVARAPDYERGQLQVPPRPR